MLDFPNAKVNLGLNITHKRTDGYHEIETCFLPIPWKDALEIIEAKTLKFTNSGLAIPGDGSDNLCMKAYELIASSFDIPPVYIHLHKVIPMGAGLGGGSADCAWTIKMINKLFSLGLSIIEMENLASTLGSDCPFFIENKPVLAFGVGDQFEPVNIDLSGYYLGLIHPEIHVSTAEAYGGVTPQKPTKDIRIIIDDLSQWKSNLTNQFETHIFQNHPKIKELKENMYADGAWYSAMSGSGSTVFGLFKKKPDQLKYDLLTKL